MESSTACSSPALASDTTLTELIPGHQHSEQEYRDFLGKVLRRLDAMRPWPKRPFQPVDPSSWNDLDSARLVARIKLSALGVEQRLHEIFRKVEDGREVITLRLNSGTEIALVAEWWAEGKDRIAAASPAPGRDRRARRVLHRDRD